MTEYQKVKEAIELHDEINIGGEGATKTEILVYLTSEYEITQEKAEMMLKECYMNGHCYQPDGEHYLVI